MIYGSICSGIEATTVAWKPLGWKPAFFSEIDPFCCTLLEHHYPEVPNYGDFTEMLGNSAHAVRSQAIDLLVGGTPCQDFSNAGKKSGITGGTGKLTLDYCRLVEILRPRWIVWENVPGILYSRNGRDFGAFLGALGHIGYGWAYRVLDAQFFGVPQRRRRVFLVGHRGGSTERAAQVLFEPPGGSGPSPAGQKTDVAQLASQRTEANDQTIKFYVPLHYGHGSYVETSISTGLTRSEDRTRSAPLIVQDQRVRRATPLECERLQGLPDGYTDVMGKESDYPRYSALGNSIAVPVVSWIGKRIMAIEEHP